MIPNTKPNANAHSEPIIVSSIVSQRPVKRALRLFLISPKIVRSLLLSVFVPLPFVYLSISFCIRPVFCIHLIPSLILACSSLFWPFLKPIAIGVALICLVTIFKGIPLRIPYCRTGPSSNVAAPLPLLTSFHIALEVVKYLILKPYLSLMDSAYKAPAAPDLTSTVLPLSWLILVILLFLPTAITIPSL